MLIVGEEGWPLEEDGAPSQKLVEATQRIADGCDIRIIPESDWLHLIGLSERRDEIQRSYTAAMLSRLLNVSVSLIRRWAMMKLIRPVRQVGRLLYFDYREVASAQRLAKLLEEGVRPEILERSLTELSNTLSGTDRSLAQLTLLVRDGKIVVRDAHGVLNPRTRQRLLDFEEAAPLKLHMGGGDANDHEQPTGSADGSAPAESDDDLPVSLSFAEARMRLDDRSMDEWTADEWFHEGCRLAEEGSLDSAINAFRNSLSLLASNHALLREPTGFPQDHPTEVFPDPADVHFHLADALYRSGNKEAAMERYHCAIEFAPDFIEAWTQLGCLQTERGEWGPAEEALLTAISIHDANPDALLHYALLLEQMGRHPEALTCWEKYLRYDSRGPWADHARKRLEEAQPLAESPGR